MQAPSRPTYGAASGRCSPPGNHNLEGSGRRWPGSRDPDARLDTVESGNDTEPVMRVNHPVTAEIDLPVSDPTECAHLLLAAEELSALARDLAPVTERDRRLAAE